MVRGQLIPPSDLRDERVRLRPVTEADVPVYAQAFVDDPDLGRILGHARDWTEDDVRAHLVRMEQRRADGGAVELAIVDPATDEFCGSILLHSVEWRHERVEVGFWLVPAARRRGLVSSAVRLVVDWAFDELDLGRIDLTTTAENVPPQRLAERLGFTREGVLRGHELERGRRVDIVVFGLLREERERLRASA